MTEKTDIDIEKTYPLRDFISKIRSLADCLENGEPFEIQFAGHRLYVPVRASYNFEYETENGSSEVEFQIKWQDETKSKKDSKD